MALCFSCTKTPSADLRQARTLANLVLEEAEPFGVAAGRDVVYVSDGKGGRVFSVDTYKSKCANPDGCYLSRVVTDKLDTPSHIALDEDGTILVADSGDHTIRRVSAEGAVSLVAGTPGKAGFLDGPAEKAQFRAPVGIAVSEGRVFVSDSYNDRIRIIEDGQVRTIAGGPRGFRDGSGEESLFDTPLGIEVVPDRGILVADSGNRRIRLIDGDGNTSTLSESIAPSQLFSMPTDVAFLGDGSVLVADGDAIRMIGGRFLPFVETVAGGRPGFADGERAAAAFNRASGIAVDESGDVFVADSENALVRVLGGRKGDTLSERDYEQMLLDASHRHVPPAERWPYDPPDAAREIAGTFGELRGEIGSGDSRAYFHNGIDIPGAFGETARFVADEKILAPDAAANFGTLREFLRTPDFIYIHISLGRTAEGKPFDDPRFLFELDAGEPSHLRVARGTKFSAGEPIGTLNRMNHVHLVAGPRTRQANPLSSLALPGVSDSIPPTIEKVDLYTENWDPIETRTEDGRIIVDGRVRIVAEGYDRMDGNPDRRRLGLYRLGYRLFDSNGARVGGDGEGEFWTLGFWNSPDDRFAGLVYARGSRSGATGPTVFRYIVSNRLGYGPPKEGFINFSKLDPGDYEIEVTAGDFFKNESSRRIAVRSR